MDQTIEDLQRQIEQLKKEKEKLDAEKAKLDAEKALADAKKALEQAATPNTELSRLQNEKAIADAKKALAEANKALATPATELSKLQEQKALADAQKALADSKKALEEAKGASSQQVTDLQSQKAIADAQKALSEAQTQAAIAKYIGEVKSGPYSGSVDMKDKAGTEEALLLAAHAVKECAAKVAQAVKDKATEFYIFGVNDFPAFQWLRNFRFRKELIKQSFAAAGVSRPADATESAPSAALVSSGLDAFSKILGFFKTDYTIGGIEAEVDETLLLFSVAGQLSEKEVYLPLVYEPNAQSGAVEALTTELAELVDLRIRAANEVGRIKNKIADAEKKAADPQNAATKDDQLATAAGLKLSLDQLNGVIAFYDSFASSLTTPDSNGALPLSTVTQELAIDAALKNGGSVLLLRLENSGGGYLLKKNLWTGLGRMPLFHMGGSTVTFLLLSGKEGKVLAADAISIYGGFVKTSKLRDELAKRTK